MIRDRRDQDLDRLCEVLDQIEGHADILAGRQARDWLQDVDPERSWVFDQAPVSVAPTRNVVGHVQIYRRADAPWFREVVARGRGTTDDLLVIGRLFVKPGRHDHGIARYLLTESVKWIETRDRVPVLDPGDIGFIPPSLCAKLGFEEFQTGDGTRGVLARPRRATRPEQQVDRR